MSDFAESRVSLRPTTRFAHGEDKGNYGVDVEQDGKIEGERIALTNSIRTGTKLHLTVKGQSWLQSGDVIEFDVLSVENKNNTVVSPDIRYSGRYIITHIRHKVSNDHYIQILECAKDGVKNSYGSAHKSYANIAGPESRKKGPVDIDSLA